MEVMETPALFIFPVGLARSMLTRSWDGFSVLHTALYLVIFCLGVPVVCSHSLRSIPTTAVINRHFAPCLILALQTPANQHGHCSSFPQPGMVFVAYSLSTVVQVTAEAGVGFYFRRAGSTALWVTDCLYKSRKKKYIKHIRT